jgi:NAD+ synthase (glutamine-hydrolysing)
VCGGDRLPRTRGRRSLQRGRSLRERRILGVYRKQRLPNYSVFDEQRYFTASADTGRPVFESPGTDRGNDL